MAMRYHPDLNPGEDARQKFLEILEAYEYLTGIRKMNKGQGLSADDLQKFYDLMQKAAEEKAKARYRERVRQFRKEQERQQSAEFQKGIFILIGLLVVGVAVWQGYSFYKQLVIQRDPVAVEATVTGIAMKRMIYEFPIGDSIVEKRTYVSNYGIDMLAGNGMPLKIGDQFELVFSGSRPGFHEINFEKVDAATLQRYLSMTARRLRYIYKNEWGHLSEADKNVRSTCISLLVFKEFGFDGLSTIYYSEANPLDNFSHNRWRWRFFSSSEEYQEILKICKAEMEAD